MARRPQRHPWYTPVAQYLKYLDRVATSELLEEALGVPPEYQSTDDGRQLSVVVAAIGGWKPSTNIKFEGRTVRGYIRSDMNHRA